MVGNYYLRFGNHLGVYRFNANIVIFGDNVLITPIITCFRKYHRKYHPLVGLLNMKLLKLALLQDDLSAAKSYYNEAKDILLVSHGNHHSLFASLQEIFSS